MTFFVFLSVKLFLFTSWVVTFAKSSFASMFQIIFTSVFWWSIFFQMNKIYRLLGSLEKMKTWNYSLTATISSGFLSKKYRNNYIRSKFRSLIFYSSVLLDCIEVLRNKFRQLSSSLSLSIVYWVLFLGQPKTAKRAKRVKIVVMGSNSG